MGRSSNKKSGSSSSPGNASGGGFGLSNLKGLLGGKLGGMRSSGAKAGSMALEAGKNVRRFAQSPIAVDFGESSLKVLQITPGSKPSLVAAATVVTPDDLRSDIQGRLEFQFDELARVIRTGGFKGKRAVCAIPASQTFCKHLQLGRAAGNERSAVVEELLSAELGRDAYTLAYRWYPVEGTIGAAASRNEAVVMAACKGLVGKLMNGLRHAKLDPVGIHNEWTADLRAFDRLHRRADDESTATLYLDVGNGGARVSVAHGSSLVFARSLEVGGRLFDEGYAAHYKLDEMAGRVERLRRLKPVAVNRVGVKVAAGQGAQGSEDRRGGGGPTGLTGAVELQALEIDPGLDDSYSILADEIAVCVRYHEALFGPRRLHRAVIFGGEARDGVLCQRVARALRVPTQVADPFSVIECGSGVKVSGLDMDEPQPGWVLALGLCESPTEL